MFSVVTSAHVTMSVFVVGTARAVVLDGSQTSIWQHDGQDLSFRNYQGGRDGCIGAGWALVLQLGKDEWGMSGLERMMMVGESCLE